MNIPSLLSGPGALLIAAAGGFIAHLLHVPLAWMIGAMLATACIAWQRPPEIPRLARPLALLVLGLALGQSFTAPVIAAVASAFPVILAAGLLSIVAGLVVGPILKRMGGLDERTAFFAGVPGGIVVMVVLAARAGVSIAPVTLSQTMRLIVVVVVFPPLLALLASGLPPDAAFAASRPPVWWPGLAGLAAVGAAIALAGERAGFANPWMFGPCLLAIGLSATGRLPSGVWLPLVDAAQVALGATLGAKLTRDFVLGSRRLALASMVSAVALSLLLALIALALALVSGLPIAAVVLGMAPGGMPEMAVTAKALDLAVPLVLGFHLTRTLLCNLAVGPLWRAVEWSRRS
ncbi:AbrB family transcriptional regulator [Plastoroseomonas arctica]|uniref:AbrB family transcriptional regulator n=1 Tax=Plastoroseomonas arctica TaxID=1509237 RepID=A0AAF1K1I5_9PROT|nr:AbrB family transcriptional regulator [Plastoroseomonas arctica]